MNFWESIKMAFDSIRAHKMRSILTMLGIVIGVSSVIVIVAIGQGGEEQLTESFAGYGNSLTIQPTQEVYIENNGTTPLGFFTKSDLRQLGEIKGVERVLTFSSAVVGVSYQSEKVPGTNVYGINSNQFLSAQGVAVEHGRSFRSSDYLGGQSGALISAKAKKELFDDENPVGKIVRIGNEPVKVIGVLEEPTGLYASFQFEEVYLTQSTWENVFGKSEISQVTLQVKEAGEMERVGDEAVTLLHRNHQSEDEYQVLNIEQLTKGIKKVTGIMTAVIGSIGGISLFVGGIGVMNIMLVSVTERTREIGIRMSLGATRANIMVQFLIESVSLCLLGGVIGLLLGAGVAELIQMMSPLSAAISIPVAIGSILFSMLFGVIFGLLPANKASRLDPIECLRYD
ncbi:ABC transporter permease [Mechercharimyces sp. CAU 1602]|uniref:ABC transporter permease n=1 Tax=Mechercharimyces sp. CAU 1602 TaxID=2973933 RepID=UPI002161598C|nr:ABC transporter permease [Mechercharimyces sp. CAU 1602]MCS1352471.1 ABC transporter permease [Mechercharimyces sp. CAU 1602]